MTSALARAASSAVARNSEWPLGTRSQDSLDSLDGALGNRNAIRQRPA